MYLLTTDWHLTDKCPQNRKDNYFLTQYKKVEYILSLARDFNASILHSGDFFDSVRTSLFVINEYIKLFKRYNIKTYVITGQHDLFFHNNNYKGTPLSILESAETVYIMDNSGKERIDFIPWGTPIPKKSKAKILVTHTMCVDEKIWSGQEDCIYGYDLLQKTNYDLILTGDNHKQFAMEYKERFLVNPGSLMRKASDQMEHKPSVWIYDDKKQEIKKYKIPVEPASKVFDCDKIETEKEINEHLQIFIDGLTDTKMEGLDFIKNLKLYCKINKIEQSVQRIINNIMENNL